MKLYTRTGDEGESGLFGGKRVPKNDARLEAYGTLDELNAHIGLALCEAAAPETRECLIWLQNVLFTAGSDLATPFTSTQASSRIKRISPEETAKAEQLIDLIACKLPELKNFILPGGTKATAEIHVARTVCRRAERAIVTAAQKEEINEKLLIFVNRISDLLFVLSRYENYASGIADTTWE